MNIAWLHPLAWWGLLALALPIVIHLLARQRSRTLPFPSLRFLHATRLTAFTRRLFSDLPLLAIRLLLLVVAVGAAAQPVFLTAARTEAWHARTARAIVDVGPAGWVPDAVARSLIDEEREAAFSSWRGSSVGPARETLAAALEWLERQPPAAREVLVVGDLRVGFIDAADVENIPTTIGIRFLPVGSARPERSLQIPITTEMGSGRSGLSSLAVVLEDEATRVVRQRAAPGSVNALSVLAAPGEQAMANVLREAVLAQGLALPQAGDRRLIIELHGAPEAPVATPPAASWMRGVLEAEPGGGGERDGALVVRVPVVASDPRAPHEIARIARAALHEPLNDREPRRISAETLAAWSRAPGAVPESAPLVDEGDRRWLWLVVLILLAVEHLMRRHAAGTADLPLAATEQRVA